MPLCRSSANKGTQVISKQIPNTIHCHVGLREGGESLGIMRILSLSRKYRGHAVAPGVFHSSENAWLVVHQHVMQCRVTNLDIVQREFLVDVNQNLESTASDRPERSTFRG